MQMTTADKLSQILDQLRAGNIHATLRHDREGAVSIDVAVPGQRWEIDVLEDGSVEIEVFKSDGEMHDEAKLSDLLERFSD
jgi:hypothetical protein